jgi:flagellar protein FlaF
MLDLDQDAALARPLSVVTAYGSVIRQTESDRDIEYRVFEKVTDALVAASRPDAHFTKRIKAIHDNRSLWQTLAFDLAGEGNALPVDLRARLISLALWVNAESNRVQQSGGSLDGLIGVNRAIMPGLRAPVQEAA